MEQRPATKDAQLEVRLRAASDGIQLVVRQLHALEEQKRGVDPGDPRFVELAALVRSISDELQELAASEEAFARELGQDAVRFDLPAIEQVAPRHDLREILEEWREVERRLAEVEPGSPEAVRLVERFEELRVEYGRAADDKRHASDMSADR